MSAPSARATHAAGGPEGHAAWCELHRLATEPYRGAGRFAWHFARGKLGRDPVFRALIERGELASKERVVDIGCGQGLLANLLHAARLLHGRGQWPASWPSPPRAASYTGIELMQRDVQRAEASLPDGAAASTRFLCADMREARLPACDAVVILDVLHYVPIADQDALLARVHAALAPGGRLLLRIGDAADRRGFAISQWVDRAVTRLRGHRVAPTFGRPLAGWAAALERIGFAPVQALPMSQGTPFANVLMVAQR